ncbi:hypothetical protein NFI96_005611 [Prochilodus magdalenae]|nr:hypothetical protein NFI96_005611 [Prochilodus magdalenae]
MSAYEGILGSEGFSSGTHSWEVEVGDCEEWAVGVAEESVSRKEECLAVPDNVGIVADASGAFRSSKVEAFDRQKLLAVMATSLLPLEQDLSCPVCFEIFNDPVILSCSHSFCRTCLQRSWEQSLGQDCPVCRHRAATDDLQTNLVLKNACESYMQQKRERESDPQRCPLHSQKLQMFCVNDEKLVCGQCVIQDHQNHSFCSINKAAGPRKEKLKTHLRTLETKLKTFITVKDINVQEASHIESQAQDTEKQIQDEFEKLHQFLREEEEAAIAALQKEEVEKSQKIMKKIEELDKHIMEIGSRVRELEVMLKNDVLVLQDFKKANQRAQYIVPEPKLQSGALIDEAKHLGNLSYRVWKKMMELCQYCPVVLDPNTANPSLSISADLKSFSNSSEDSQFPDNPERMTGYSGILGSVGYSSGDHSWDVEIGDSEDWIVGVAEESVNRKKLCGAVPENGFCCIWRDGDEIKAAVSRSATETLMTSPTIKKIRVTLQLEKGLVTFTNPASNTDLYTFTRPFTKKVYPYFSNGSKHSLKVLPPSNNGSKTSLPVSSLYRRSLTMCSSSSF